MIDPTYDQFATERCIRCGAVLVSVVDGNLTIFGTVDCTCPDPVEEATCRWCGRRILDSGVDRLDRWIDPEARGEDGIWREVCGSHDTFTAEHEPA